MVGLSLLIWVSLFFDGIIELLEEGIFSAFIFESVFFLFFFFFIFCLALWIISLFLEVTIPLFAGDVEKHRNKKTLSSDKV